MWKSNIRGLVFLSITLVLSFILTLLYRTITIFHNNTFFIHGGLVYAISMGVFIIIAVLGFIIYRYYSAPRNFSKRELLAFIPVASVLMSFLFMLGLTGAYEYKFTSDSTDSVGTYGLVSIDNTLVAEKCQRNLKKSPDVFVAVTVKGKYSHTLKMLCPLSNNFFSGLAYKVVEIPNVLGSAPSA